MAYLTNSIAFHRFTSLRGEPIPPMQAAFVDDRPGVDGVEVQQLGEKGTPFSLVSGVDVSSYSFAKVLAKSYTILVDGGTCELIQGGVNYDAIGFRVLVLKVEELRCFPISGAIGNTLNTPSAAYLECRWDLIAVPFEV
jgi:hypothetical protein